MPIYKSLVVGGAEDLAGASILLALASVWRELDQELTGVEAGCNL